MSDFLHSIPVTQMGNYQEYLKLMPSPLREIDPDQPKRLHTFGNPFKQDKKVEKPNANTSTGLADVGFPPITHGSRSHMANKGDDD